MEVLGSDALERLRKAQNAIAKEDSAPAAAPTPPAQAGNWRVRPKKQTYRQINVRIRDDLYELLGDLAQYTEGESMNSIAGRGIEKEIKAMLRERGEI
jgi:hypothetical protein